MLMEAKNNIKYIIKAVICNIKSAWEYKNSFITQAVFMFINNGFFIIFWNVVFGITNNKTNGIQMKEILLIWSISTIGYGLAEFFLGGIENISKYIITGGLDSYIVQPKNVFISIATSRCDFSAFGDLMYGLIIGIFASDSLLKYFKILVYAVIGSIIFVAIITAIRSLAIYLGDIEDLVERYEHTFLINFSTYPEKIFGIITKFCLFTIIPAGYIAHLPVRLILKFNTLEFLWLLIATLIFIIIAIILFKQVLKKYESGNAMTLKG